MSTIVGNVKQISTAASRTLVEFYPKSTPVVASGSMIVTSSLKVRPNDDGDFVAVLAMGDYEVVIGVDRFKINVPNDSNSYDFIQRIIEALVFDSTAPVGGAQPNASTTVFGLVKTHANSVAPVVPLYSEMTAADDALADLIDTAQATANDAKFMTDTLPAGQLLTIPEQKQIVVADAYTVEDTAELTVNGILGVF